MERRGFIGAVAALAGVRWEEAGYDPDNAENWDPMKGSGYTTGRFETGTCSASGHLGYTHFEGEECSPHIAASYGPDGPYLIVEGERDDLRLGLLAELPPDEMKQVAAALYQAAWESENRPEASEELLGISPTDLRAAEDLIREETDYENIVVTADQLVAESEFDRQTITAALVRLQAKGELDSDTIYWNPELRTGPEVSDV